MDTQSLIDRCIICYGVKLLPRKFPIQFIEGVNTWEGEYFTDAQSQGVENVYYGWKVDTIYSNWLERSCK